ncbi:hypothetical protein POUND7_006955 [Theobroma cacao]
MSLKKCEAECLKNCSCAAYANLNITGGGSCLMWFGDLIDIRELSEVYRGEEVYIRLPASSLDGLLHLTRAESGKEEAEVPLFDFSSMENATNNFCYANAWLLWNEDRALELIDTSLEESCVRPEVVRCIQVGLLCVQEFPEDRPAMSSVLLMLTNESAATLPQPKPPGFFIQRKSSTNFSGTTTTKEESMTGNAVTITVLEAR